MHRLNEGMNNKFKIEEGRRQVASMLAESNDRNRNSITDGMYILLNQHAAKSQLLSTYSRVLAIATSLLSCSLL